MNVRARTLLGTGFGFPALLLVSFFFFNRRESTNEDADVRKLMRVVTPLPVPKVLDLPQDKMEIHYAGFKTLHMHNLTDMFRTLLLSMQEFSVNLPSVLDIVFVSGTDSQSPRIKERINALTGTFLTHQLNEKQKLFEDEYNMCFNTMDKVDSEATFVGKAAIANLLGGIGYFYGQSKIALPKGFTQKHVEKFISYWPAALYTAVPRRSYFPRGFLWDEVFHQLLIWRWDIDICMDILGHWLDLINENGWIPREQILGAEALRFACDGMV